jgi:hypothetical protein
MKYIKQMCLKMPKIKLQTLKNTNFSRSPPPIVCSLSLDSPSTEKFLKEALRCWAAPPTLLIIIEIIYSVKHFSVLKT